MSVRTTYSHLSPAPVLGADFLEEYAARIKTLFDASALPLTSIGGTANDITATLDPVLDGGGLIEGMKLTFTPPATNTDAMTLALNGGSPVALLDAAGSALVPGACVAGTRVLVEVVGSALRILAGGTGSGFAAAPSYQAFTASGTWTKPAGYPDDHMVTIEMWGGGGGGSRKVSSLDGSGGGGGGYAEVRIRMADLPSSVTVTIGAGGLGRTGSSGDGGIGGNTTFGSICTAFGGGGGGTGVGGGGGGSHAAGAVGSTVAASIGGGPGGSGAAGVVPGTIWGGAGGGGGTYAGGDAIKGGAGGGGSGSSAVSGGISVFGGDGGDGGDASPTPTAGQAPGGGGGGGFNVNGADGARGEVRIWL